jgi:hypothetical protein
MNVKIFSCCFALSCLYATLVFAPMAGAQTAGSLNPQYSVQGAIAPAALSAQGGPVSYASVTQVNGLLSQLEDTSKSAQGDLSKLRIERWKTDSAAKRQSLSDVDSIQRNLQSALPEMVAQVRNAPEDLPATFQLYRNLDALYSVMSSVVESAGAFGPKDDFQSLSNDLNALEMARKQFAERMNSLASSKEQEIVRLRADLKAAQAAIPAAPPKKVIVDDTQPEKKPAPKKKPVSKKPATTPKKTPPASTTPGQAQASPSQPQ